jgi:O-antigen ligase
LIIFYNTDNKYIKYFIFIFIILLTAIIWAAQSRGTLICYFLLIILITLFNIKKVFKKILYIISFIFVPVIIYTLIVSTFAISDKNSSNVNIYENNSSNVNIYKDVIYKSRIIDNKTSSGRLEIWSDILNKFDKTRFFGYGPQADRNLVGRELTKKFSNNASNLYIYAFACGGYIAVIIFLIINIQIIKNLYQVVFERKLFLSKNNFEIKYSAALLLFFLIRGLIENSYSLFSIDFLLVIISMSIIKNYLKSKS